MSRLTTLRHFMWHRGGPDGWSPSHDALFLGHRDDAVARTALSNIGRGRLPTGRNGHVATHGQLTGDQLRSGEDITQNVVYDYFSRLSGAMLALPNDHTYVKLYVHLRSYFRHASQAAPACRIYVSIPKADESQRAFSFEVLASGPSTHTYAITKDPNFSSASPGGALNNIIEHAFRSSAERARWKESTLGLAYWAIATY